MELKSLDEKLLANSFYGGYIMPNFYKTFIITPTEREECDNSDEIERMRMNYLLKAANRIVNKN